MRQLLVATRNVHKTEEISFILEGLFRVLDLSAVADAPEVEETGTPFIENARLKAVAISKTTGGLVLADDSGLEVDALGGEPGVYSARYAGPGAEDATNNRKLLAELAGIPEQKRTGRFRCVMVISREGEVLEEFEGCVEGMILEEEKGAGGFGYDPLFVPEGHTQSFAELGPRIKNGLSHRARAMEKVVAWLRLAD